jgi:hypothetical protein
VEGIAVGGSLAGQREGRLNEQRRRSCHRSN